MKVVVAANYRMRKFASSCIKSAKNLGYSVIVYNLGGLGFGKPFYVDSSIFHKKGYYGEITKDRYSPGKHKPAVIKDCLHSYREPIIYLDADTIVLNKIDDLVGNYDIGLTVRPEWEVKKVTRNLISDDYFIYDAYINTGVMYFNATEAAYHFLELWERKTLEFDEDQGAVNDMLKKYFPLKSGQLIELEGIKIHTFDTLSYNHYYFQWPKIHKLYSVTENDIKIKWQDAKILHFKGRARQEYYRLFHPFKFYFIKVFNFLSSIKYFWCRQNKNERI